MSPELVNYIITSVIAAIVGAFLGRYGFMRNLTALVDSRVQKVNTDAQIALTREQTDMQAVISLRDQLVSLTDLLRTQLVQEAQRSTQSTTAQNNLTSKITEVLDELRTSQRTANNRVDDVLRSHGQDIKDVNVGFRTISDGFLLSNSSMTRIIQKWDTGMDDIRSMFSNIRDDIATLRSDADFNTEYVGEVLEIAITMRNTIFTLTGQGDEQLIRSPFDTRPIPVPYDLMFKHHEIKRNQTDPNGIDTTPILASDIPIETEKAVLPAEEQPNENPS